MEFVEAPSLKMLLRSRRLGVDEAVALGKFLLDASQYLLRLDLVHGDIKPENILVSTDYDTLHFKLIDLGSATVLLHHVTRRHGQVISPRSGSTKPPSPSARSCTPSARPFTRRSPARFLTARSSGSRRRNSALQKSRRASTRTSRTGSTPCCCAWSRPMRLCATRITPRCFSISASPEKVEPYHPKSHLPAKDPAVLQDRLLSLLAAILLLLLRQLIH